jgi:hypothetical protein
VDDSTSHENTKKKHYNSPTWPPSHTAHHTRGNLWDGSSSLPAPSCRGARTAPSCTWEQTQLGNPPESACSASAVAYFLIGRHHSSGRALRTGQPVGIQLDRTRHRPRLPARSAPQARRASSGRSRRSAMPVYVMPLVFGGATAGQRPGHRWRSIHPRPRSTRCSMLDSCGVSGAGMVL